MWIELRFLKINLKKISFLLFTVVHPQRCSPMLSSLLKCPQTLQGSNFGFRRTFPPEIQGGKTIFTGFSVDTFHHFGPRILNSQIKRPCLTRKMSFEPFLPIWISEFADKKSANNDRVTRFPWTNFPRTNIPWMCWKKIFLEKIYLEF